MDLWLLLAAFVLGAAVWPLTQLAMVVLDWWGTRVAIKQMRQRHMMEREELEKRLALGANKITDDEYRM